MGEIEKALDNLALAATVDATILQQLTAANLSLTATVAALTATIKKLGGTGNPAPVTPAARTPAKGGRPTKTPHPGNYCWTHGHRVNIGHTSATCTHKAKGHCDDATAANTLGGSELDKGWDKPRT